MWDEVKRRLQMSGGGHVTIMDPSGASSHPGDDPNPFYHRETPSPSVEGMSSSWDILDYVTKTLVKQLTDSLMECELQVVESVDALNLEYVKDQEQLAAQNRELFTGFFTRLVDLENAFFEKQGEKVLQLWERAQNDDHYVNALATEAARNLLTGDKDAMLTAINGMHDARIARLNAREELFGKQERARFERLVQGTKDREYRRNRNRTQEIWGVGDAAQSEAEQLMQMLNAEEA
jgi:hypothetical protein